LRPVAVHFPYTSWTALLVFCVFPQFFCTGRGLSSRPWCFVAQSVCIVCMHVPLQYLCVPKCRVVWRSAFCRTCAHPFDAWILLLKLTSCISASIELVMRATAACVNRKLSWFLSRSCFANLQFNTCKTFAWWLPASCSGASKSSGVQGS